MARVARSGFVLVLLPHHPFGLAARALCPVGLRMSLVRAVLLPYHPFGLAARALLPGRAPFRSFEPCSCLISPVRARGSRTLPGRAPCPCRSFELMFNAILVLLPPTRSGSWLVHYARPGSTFLLACGSTRWPVAQHVRPSARHTPVGLWLNTLGGGTGLLVAWPSLTPALGSRRTRHCVGHLLGSRRTRHCNLQHAC